MSQGSPLSEVLLSSADLEERRLLYAEIREAGYQIMPVESILDALRAVLLKVAQPTLVVLDVHDDPEGTRDHVEQLLALLPGVPLVLMVGGGSAEIWEPLRPHVAALLRRPIRIGEIVDVVRRISPSPVN
jgi:DNA-binding NtrC family response regulator